jgi:hypothetical protein
MTLTNKMEKAAELGRNVSLNISRKLGPANFIFIQE